MVTYSRVQAQLLPYSSPQTSLLPTGVGMTQMPPDPRAITQNRRPTRSLWQFGHELFPTQLPGVGFFNEKVVRARAGLLLVLGLILLVVRLDHGNHHQYVLPSDYAEVHQLEGRVFSPMPTGEADEETVYSCPMHPQEVAHEPASCADCGMALVAEADANSMPPLVPRQYDHRFAQGLLWFVVYEMIVATLFGMTLSPLGWLAVLLTWNQVPEWTAARPKRMAWSIGVVFSVLCQLALTWGVFMSIALYVLFLCVLFMFLEAAIGFCTGCWLYGLLPASWTSAPERST